MKLRPIVGRQHEVRAILAGHQTQIRRVMKVQPECISELWQWIGKGTQIYEGKNLQSLLSRLVSKCPYGVVGDRLWIKEGYRIELNLGQDTDGNWSDADGLFSYFYKADCSNPEGWGAGGWKSAVHMPRAASRIAIEITNIRIEQLQEITKADAIAEGAPPSHWSIDCISREFGFPDFSRSWFAQTWDQINKKYPWSDNPWVWVVEFKYIGGAA